MRAHHVQRKPWSARLSRWRKRKIFRVFRSCAHNTWRRPTACSSAENLLPTRLVLVGNRAKNRRKAKQAAGGKGKKKKSKR